MSQKGAEALREILKLYDFADSASTRAMIDGVRAIRSRRVVGRVGGQVAGGFCRGLEVTLQLDEEKFSGGGVFPVRQPAGAIPGAVHVDHSFTKTIVHTVQREEPLRRWPPRAGEQVLL